MGAKATLAEVELRIEKVYEMFISGCSYMEIVQYAEAEWDIKSRMTDNYIKRAKERIIEDVAERQTRALSEHIAARKYLYRMLMKQGRYKDAKDVLDSLAKIEGLWVDKGEVKVNDTREEMEAARNRLDQIAPQEG